MVVEGKKAGTATITVMVYDGVTDPISETFDVMVVSHNARPIVDLDPATVAEDGDTIPAATLTSLRRRLFISSGGGSETELSAIIHAGAAGTFEDAVTFSYAMGGSGTEDDIVSVEITPKKGVANTWKIALTPLKSGMQNVYITVKDKFGATAEIPTGNGSGTVDGDEPNTAQRLQFVAFVNTVPSLDNALADKTIVGTGTTSYTTAEHFVTGETTPKAGPKVGKMTADAAAPTPTGTDETTSDTTCSATSSKPGVATVGEETSGAFTVTGVATGTTDVTITCRDDEGFATDTAMITVRAVR